MKRILIVDDDVNVRTMIRHFLEKAGYLVADASNGELGLELCREAPFDLIIIDIFMPEKEGLETIREIRRDFPEAKIIAISGGGTSGEFSYLSLAKNFGAMRAMAKPFYREELIQVVKELLGQE